MITFSPSPLPSGMTPGGMMSVGPGGTISSPTTAATADTLVSGSPVGVAASPIGMSQPMMMPQATAMPSFSPQMGGMLPTAQTPSPFMTVNPMQQGMAQPSLMQPGMTGMAGTQPTMLAPNSMSSLPGMQFTTSTLNMPIIPGVTTPAPMSPLGATSMPTLGTAGAAGSPMMSPMGVPGITGGASMPGMPSVQAVPGASGNLFSTMPGAASLMTPLSSMVPPTQAPVPMAATVPAQSQVPMAPAADPNSAQGILQNIQQTLSMIMQMLGGGAAPTAATPVAGVPAAAALGTSGAGAPLMTGGGQAMMGPDGRQLNIIDPNGGAAHIAPTSGPQAAGITPQKQELLNAINQYRAQNGLGPVQYNPALDQASQGHSNDMASTGTMSHTGSGGTDPGQRISASGYQWTHVNENVAAGQDNVNQVLQDWIRSPGHNKNLLDPNVTEIGLGVTGNYYAMNMGRS
jgi:uncharacterized protein YkwD